MVVQNHEEKNYIKLIRNAAALGVKPPDAGGQGGVGSSPQPPTNFYGFHINNTHFNTLFCQKRACSDAITMDNTKIFLQLISKNRGLAKISEGRLQPLLVQEIAD